MEVSTSPRIILEFKDCKKEDWLDWNIKGIQVELGGCAKYPDEAIALKAVDEETGEMAGYAVWGWSERVSVPSMASFTFDSLKSKLPVSPNELEIRRREIN